MVGWRSKFCRGYVCSFVVSMMMMVRALVAGRYLGFGVFLVVGVSLFMLFLMTVLSFVV